MSSILAAGDAAVVVRDAEVALVSTRGVLARWPRLPRERPIGDGVSFGPCVVDVATCAAPPRLALLFGAGEMFPGLLGPELNLAETWLDIIDVPSGELQGRVELSRVQCALGGFAPGGDVLLVNEGTDVVIRDGAGALERRLPGANAELVRFSADARRVCFRVPRARRVLRVDLDGDVTVDASGNKLVAAAAIHAIDGAVSAIVGDADLHEIAVLESEGGADFAAIRDTTTGARAHTFEVRPPSLRRLFARRDLREVCVVDSVGTVVTYRRVSGPARRFQVGLDDAHGADLVSADVEGDRLLWMVRGQARLRTLSNRRIAAFAGAKAFFAGTTAPLHDGVESGPAVVLSAGQLRVLDSGTPERVPGPERIVDACAHPRGVLVLDVEQRAYVIDL